MATETKPRVHCPNCDSSNTVDDGIFDEERYFACQDCGYTWEVVERHEDDAGPRPASEEDGSGRT